ncbi:MAG TPA: nucleoside 2-deoxyribosyltransferase domain-containing protein [Candidatus Paceibacterota bacterium]|nr:nucleoside 2-deoxyribosyltransferase domain-containing protein [Candidatus Paceibacterota bacterium]
MMIITPPDFVTDRNAAVLFLGGPIRETPDWRAEAIRIISKNNGRVYVASPQRPGGIYPDFEGSECDVQTRWEVHHLFRALRKGAVLFWFPKKQPYLRNSGLELGASLVSAGNVVVGIETGFPEEYLRAFIREKSPDVKICNDFEETCLTALALAEAAL